MRGVLLDCAFGLGRCVLLHSGDAVLHCTVVLLYSVLYHDLFGVLLVLCCCVAWGLIRAGQITWLQVNGERHAAHRTCHLFTLLGGTACVLHDALAVKHVFASGECSIFCVNLLFQIVKSSTQKRIYQNLNIQNKYERQLVFSYNSEQKMNDILIVYLGDIIINIF